MIFSAGRKRFLSLMSAGAVALGLILSAGSAAFAQAAAAVKPVGKADEAALLRPSPLKDMSEGEQNAPITVIEYASFSCGHCADFYAQTMPQLREKYIKTGKVHYIFRELTVDSRGLAAAMLTRCVGQDKFFPLTQLLFEKQMEWAFVPDAKTPLMRYAKMAGLDEAQFNACLTNQKMFEEFQKAAEQSMKDFNIRVTPTLFINGEQYEGALTMDQLAPILDKMLEAKK